MYKYSCDMCAIVYYSTAAEFSSAYNFIKPVNKFIFMAC